MDLTHLSSLAATYTKSRHHSAVLRGIQLICWAGNLATYVTLLDFRADWRTFGIVVPKLGLHAGIAILPVLAIYLIYPPTHPPTHPSLTSLTRTPPLLPPSSRRHRHPHGAHHLPDLSGAGGPVGRHQPGAHVSPGPEV